MSAFQSLQFCLHSWANVDNSWMVITSMKAMQEVPSSALIPILDAKPEISIAAGVTNLFKPK